jgi:enoyl-CoA hydratase/carnithine racemase
MARYLEVERQGNICVLVLQRPEKDNALNYRLARELVQALSRLERARGISCLVVTGAGDQAFCSGADLEERRRGPTLAATREAMAMLERLPIASIAAVNGRAHGGGALLAVSCDLRLAAPQATFRFPGANLGLVVGAAQLPRLVGLARAKELIYTGRVVSAEEAAAIGLVNRVIPAVDLMREAHALAEIIAANSCRAIAAAKKVMELAADNRVALELELETNAVLRRSTEFRQRARRFVGR